MESNKSLREDLIKIFVDKFLFGLLIVIAGLIANAVLEKYKSKQSFIKTLNEKRIEKLSQAWTYVNKVDNTLIAIIEDYDSLNRADQKALNLGDQDPDSIYTHYVRHLQSQSRFLIDKANSIYNEAIFFINENQFWFTVEEKTSLLHFIELSKEYSLCLIAFPDNDEVISDLKTELDDCRVNIIRWRDELFEE